MTFDLGHFLARRAVAQVAQLQRTAVAAALWSRKCALLLATTAAIAANAGNAVPGKVKLIPWSGRGDWCMATLFAAVSAARQQPAALFSARKLAGFLAGLCYGSMQPKAHGLDRVVAWRAWRAFVARLAAYVSASQRFVARLRARRARTKMARVRELAWVAAL